MYLQHSPLEMVKWFLSAKVYVEAPNQTLSEIHWNQRKAVILLKSVYLQTAEGRSFTAMMEGVCEYNRYNMLLYIKCNIEIEFCMDLS